jgi:hypothetical protein
MCVFSYIDKSRRIGKDVANGATVPWRGSEEASQETLCLLIAGQLCRERSFGEAKMLRQRRKLRMYSTLSRMTLVLLMDDGWPPDVTDQGLFLQNQFLDIAICFITGSYDLIARF